MKILWLSEGDSPYDSRFLKKLVDRGHKPLFLSYGSGDIGKVDGVKTIHLPILRGLGDRRRYHWIKRIAILRHLRKVIREFKPHILHSGYIRFHGYYGALSGFHPTLSMPWGSDILIRPDKSEYDMRMVRYTLQRADMITCDCGIVKKRIMEISGCSSEKVVVFPWGIDLSTFYPFDSGEGIRKKLGWENNKILIMTRDFRPIYGHDVFINSLPDIIARQPEIRVVFVGSGPLKKSCEDKIAELGLINHVYFAGKVNDMEMAEYLNAADIYITTSHSDGTSACMLEAMACGLPVIVSDAPAYHEWVEDGVNGYIVPRSNSQVLLQRILDILDKPQIRHEMSRRNILIAQSRADFEHNISILESIYGRLILKKEQHDTAQPLYPIKSLFQAGKKSPGRAHTFGKRVFKDFFNVKNDSAMLEVHLKETIKWLASAQEVNNDGGISTGYSLNGWKASYPETTGYIIPTLLDYVRFSGEEQYAQRAIQAAEFLLKVQMENGAVPSGKYDGRPPIPSVFNTAQVIQGWVRVFKETRDERYIHAAESAAKWLIDVQDDDGRFRKHEFLGTEHVYNTRVAWILVQLSEFSAKDSCLISAKRNIEWALTQQQTNGWFQHASFVPDMAPLTHTIGYTMEGLLEYGKLLSDKRSIDAALLCARALLKLQMEDGSLYGEYDSNWNHQVKWKCMTGNAQIGLAWLQCYQETGEIVFLEASDRMLDSILQKQDISSKHNGVRGGLSGSDPIYGGYMPFMYPCWSAKFLADFLILRLKEKKEDSKQQKTFETRTQKSIR